MITWSVANAEGRRLVEAVRKLSCLLLRPVSGRDLELHFRSHPKQRPLLLQTLGQQLLKTARPFTGVERVFQVGIIGNRAYYVADEDPSWGIKLACFEAETRLRQAIKDDLLSKVRVLFGGPQEGLARNALAGWGREMAQLRAGACDPGLRRTAETMIGAALKLATPSFDGKAPEDLMTRAETVCLLERELNRRAAYRLEAGGVNWNRLVTAWTWPQSRLFTRLPGSPVHCRAQITLLALTLWPEFHEEPERAKGQLWALRYGMAHPGAGGVRLPC